MAGALPLAVRTDIDAGARSVMTPPPSGFVATWKKLEKLEPVESVPMLLMVAERVVAESAVAMVGVTEPAVRSGMGFTETVTETSDEVPPGPVHWKVKVVLTVRGPVNTLPESVPELDHGPPAVQLVASVEPQVSVELAPYATEIGEAVSEAVGTGAPHPLDVLPNVSPTKCATPPSPSPDSHEAGIIAPPATPFGESETKPTSEDFDTVSGAVGRKRRAPNIATKTTAPAIEPLLCVCFVIIVLIFQVYHARTTKD